MSDKMYSTDGESFYFDTDAEALQALADDGQLEVGASYYEVDFETVYPAEYFRADRILDEAQDMLWGDIGESAEDAFSVPDSARLELDELLTAWANKHFTGHWWRAVGKSRELKVTAEQVAEYGP